MPREHVDKPVTDREANHVLQGLAGELKANGLPSDKLSHHVWRETFTADNELHIEYSLTGLTSAEAGRLMHILTKGRQA